MKAEVMDAFAHGLAAYSLQILVVVAIASCSLFAIRARPPRFRLSAWRAVLLVCLLLPLMPPRSVDVNPAAAADVSVSFTQSGPSAASGRISAGTPLGWVAIAGAAARALWLVVGLFRLRSLREDSASAALPDDLAAMHRTLAPAADIRWHDRLGQPVTFGLRHPVVLLPSRLRELPADLQRAVLCHELLHARRGDWHSTLFEEIVRTVFWFHPAIRWVIGQIQLCREETVDALAVAITASRRRYMRALLAFAQTPAAALTPAPLFVRRRHLVARIRQLSQEVVMSRTRMISSAAGFLIVLVASGWTVGSAIPVRTELRPTPPARQAAADVSVAVPPAAVDSAAQRIAPALQPSAQPAPPPPPPQPPPSDGKTNPLVISETKPSYPQEALPHGVAANVWVTVTIDASGQVAEAKAARFQLTIDRSIDDPNYWASGPERPFMEAAEAAAMRWKFAPPDAATRTSVELLFTFRNVPGPDKGLEALTSKIRNAPDQGVAKAIQPAGRSVPPVLRVGGQIRAPQKVVDVRPVYPANARAQNVQGVVILEIRIGVDGSIVDARILRSIPLLDDAALTAARQWKFTPTLLNGVPVEVTMTAVVNFSLRS